MIYAAVKRLTKYKLPGALFVLLYKLKLKKLTPFCVMICLDHKPLHTYMDKNEDIKDYHRSPTFPELFVTKLLVTQATTRYQMKDMNTIFPMIPLSFL